MGAAGRYSDSRYYHPPDNQPHRRLMAGGMNPSFDPLVLRGPASVSTLSTPRTRRFFYPNPGVIVHDQ